MTDSENGFSYASIWRRVGALALDNLIVALPLGLLLLVVATIGLANAEDKSLDRLGFLLWCSYMAMFQCSRSMATPGMAILGLKIHDENGDRLTFWRCFFRILTYHFLTALFFISWWQVWLLKRPRPLHDELFDAHVSFHPKSQPAHKNTLRSPQRKKRRYQQPASKRPDGLTLDEAIAWEKEHAKK